MRIATVNVNGVRAALRKGMAEWLDASGADVVCLQEVRAPDDVVRDAFEGPWHVAHTESEIKGRAGVAILSRTPMLDVRTGLAGADGASHTGRWIEAVIPVGASRVTVASVYVHSGEAGTPKMDDKYAFLDRMTERMGALAAVPAIVMGDINIAHAQRDLRNWRGNLKSAGFLPEERAYLDRWLGSGWVDVHRRLAGDVDGPYTWWSQRGKAFDTDTGWRLDYQWATAPLGAAALAARVDRAPAWDARWSDHAPLVIDYGVPGS